MLVFFTLVRAFSSGTMWLLHHTDCELTLKYVLHFYYLQCLFSSL